MVWDAIRSEGVTTPILVLTAKSGDLDQTDLLDAGADDFLVKPVSLELIAARLRAIIRRKSELSNNVFTRNELTYDLASRRCTVTDKGIHLTKREDQVLRRLLIANSGYVTREELLADVWGSDNVTDDSIVDIYLRRLRDKLAPVPIQNLRGLGYRV